ncbi:MAG: hypothetical protein JWM99_1773 [Verrucomicrobiales bacterium]|nr:hypothetical protein [Verrucomicrobiales bacterium]
MARVRITIGIWTVTIGKCCRAVSIARGLFLLFCAVTLAACSSVRPKQKGDSIDWGFIKFTEVRAFRTNWKDKYSMNSILTRHGHLNRTRIPRKGVSLDDNQISLLRSAIVDLCPPHQISFCFDPHHAFVFYRDQKIVGYIDICFQCQKHHGEPNGFGQWLDWKALSTLVEDLGMPIQNPKWNDER